MALEELGERQCVFTMSLPSEGERLKTLQKQESGKGVKRRPEVTEEFCAKFDGESDGTKGIAEFETVISLRGLCESGEFTRLRPVEFA